MASELSKFFEEISSEKSKFAEKVKNDTDLQSMFGQIAELKKESDKRKEEVEKKYAVPNLEESKHNLLDELINISTKVQEPEPVIVTPAVIPDPLQPEDKVIPEEVEISAYSHVKERTQEPSIVDQTITQIKKSNVQEQAENDRLEREFKTFKNLVSRQLESLGGGGAVNIRDLDDIDRATVLVDGKFLKYRSSDGKFIGADTPSAFSGSFTDLSNKPTTIAGYGITDSLQLGTTATTALAGNTSIPTAVSELTNDSNFISNSIDIDKLTLVDTDTGSTPGPSIDLHRNSASPANGDYLGEIDFRGESSTSVTRSYAQIKGKIGDPTNTSEDGLMEFWIRKNGSNTVTARINENGLFLNTGFDIKFEGGTADAFETTLTAGTGPSADRTITLPDLDGTVVVNNSGTVMMSSLPTSDPNNAGQLWNDSGTLKISAG